MLAVCAAGRILNPKTARSQVIGAMTMGVGAALMEEAVVDKRFGYFVNHDLASYEVPVHADIPHQDVIFLRSEEHTSELQSLMRITYAVICLKKKKVVHEMTAKPYKSHNLLLMINKVSQG